MLRGQTPACVAGRPSAAPDRPACTAHRSSSTSSGSTPRAPRRRTRRTSPRLAREGAAAAARDDPAGGHLLGAVDASPPGSLPREHGIVANGWYFRDLARGLALAAVEPARRGREGLGRGARGATRASPCAKLFWWYNMYSTRRLVGHAAPDVPGRRPQAPGHLHRARRAPRRAQRAARASSRSSTSGARRPTSRRAGGSPTARAHVLRHAAADAHARLPAAPRLRPAAPRARAHPRDRAATCGRSTRVVRRADRARRERDGRAGRRAVRVRHHAR